MQYIIHYIFFLRKYSIRTAHSYLSSFFDCEDYHNILSHILQKPKVYFVAHDDDLLSFSEKFHLLRNLSLRTKGVPLAYLTGTKEFFGLDFYVTKDTLIPRPESEHIIEDILAQHAHTTSPMLFCDIGTGSGNLIISLVDAYKKRNQRHYFCASDISQKALKIARHNAHTHNALDDITFFTSDLLHNENIVSHITAHAPHCENMIFIANLPYVDNMWKKDLYSKEESRGLVHEPAIALWAKDSGLYLYKKLLPALNELHAQIPHTTFTIYCEINNEQRDLLETFCTQQKLIPVDFLDDLSGKARVCKITLFPEKKK